jgi:DegV family protein with EDD domain
VQTAPFHIDVGGKHFVDDDSLDYENLLTTIDKSPEVAKTAAPSPFDFTELFDKSSSGVFIITISSRLSASYNSAMLAKRMLIEKFKGLKVHVVDSRSASVGQTHLALKIRQMQQEGQSFEEIAQNIDVERDKSELLFLLDNLETLIKNGRMSFLSGIIAQFLHIKPIMTATSEGEIGLVDKTRTSSKALAKLAKYVADARKELKNNYAFISHVQAEARAKELKSQVEAIRDFKEIFVVPMRGLSSVYANRGGLICSV